MRLPEGLEMGDLLYLHCDECGLERDESVGWGRAMIGSELYACYPCQRFVVHEVGGGPVLHAQDLPAEGPARCHRCQETVVPVVVPSNNAVPGASEFADVPCPKCGGVMHVECVGIWD